MGNFTPLPLPLCVCVSAWGIFTSVLIDCLSCFDISFDELVVLDGSGDGDQFRRFGSFAPGFFRLFPHVRNLDALQNCFNTVVDLAQRLANVAAVALTALSANGDAGSDKQWPIDRLNDLKSRNRMRCTRQHIATVDAML